MEGKPGRKLRKLWAMEARDAKGGFSNHAIALNKTFMHPSFRKKLERYAKGERITLEAAVGRALNVVDRLHTETSKEWTGKKGNLSLILLGTEEPVYNLNLLPALLDKGRIPRDREDAKEVAGRHAQWNALIAKTDARVVIKKGFGSYEIFDGSGGESLWKGGGAAYGKDTSNFVLKVLKGKKLDNRDIDVVVHEVGESLGEIEYGPMHTLDKPTEREREIREKMLAKLKGIFPEYY